MNESALPSAETPRKRTLRARLLAALPGVCSLLFHLGLIVLLARFAVARGTFTPQAEVRIEYAADTPLELEAPPERTEDLLQPLEQLVPPLLLPSLEKPVEAPVLPTAVAVEEPALADLPALHDSMASRMDARLGSTSFGFREEVAGALVGTMYDLKRDARGLPRAVEDYVADVRGILENRMRAGAFAGFHPLPRRLYFTHLFVPNSPASAAPAAFGVEDLMEARRWVVHYAGEIQPPEPGRFRFVGVFDDLLVVAINGKTVLEFLWTGDPSPWAPQEFVDQLRRSPAGRWCMAIG